MGRGEGGLSGLYYGFTVTLVSQTTIIEPIQYNAHPDIHRSSVLPAAVHCTVAVYVLRPMS